MRLLLAEDERDLHQILYDRLTADGYSVDSCFDGECAMTYFDATQYDAAILDIMMPKKSGLEVLKALRAQKNTTPVLLLTAKDSVEDRVRGLDTGANDYLVKPFSYDELTARLRAMLRTQFGQATPVIQWQDLCMDPAARTVTRDDTEIALSAKEFALLEYFMLNPGIVLSREKIENHLWNFEYEGGTNAVDVYIRYLRKKLDDPFDQKYIHTVRGVGYVLKEQD